MKMLANKPIKFWIWPAANMLMFLVCVALLILVFGNGDILATRAFNSGQQLIISLKDGSVEGLPLVTEEAINTNAADVNSPSTANKQPYVKSSVPGEFGAAAPQPPSAAKLAPAADDIAAEAKNVNTEISATDDLHASDENDGDRQLVNTNAAEAAVTTDTAPVSATNAEEVEHVQADPDSAKITTAAPVANVQVGSQSNPFLNIPRNAGRPLTVAPIAEITETTAIGALPKISEDGGLRPWREYAKPFNIRSNKPLVAVIITGLGLGRYTTEAAFNLPENFTFSFSPYAREVELWGNHARNIGHEVLLDLPVQTTDYPATDPGPYALLNSLTVADNRSRLHWILSRFSGYVGLLLPADSVIPQAVILSAMAEIGGRGLLLIDIAGTAADILDKHKAEMGVQDLTASLIIDEELSELAIKNQLNKLVHLAKKQGYAIGVARSYPMTIKALDSWYQQIKKEKEILLAPVSAIARKNSSILGNN